MSPLALVVLLPLTVGTLLCWAVGRVNTPWRRQASAWLAAAVTAAALALLLGQAGAVFAGQTLLAQTEWLPAIGLNLGLRLDGLALMFALLITGIGLLIILYAAWYLHHDDPAGKFYSLLMLFMAAMLGIALSDNLLLLVVFWELTSVSSFLLVGYWGHKADARAGARMALAVTGGGGLVMLAGVRAAGPDRRHLRAVGAAGHGRAGAGPCAVPAGAGADPGRLLHQERAVAVPLLAARGHGRAHAGVGLPALGHHGQGRHLPAARLYPVLGGTALFEARGGHGGPGRPWCLPPMWRCSSTT